jgi:quercetin dioxygenase-like cupin family protein
MRFPNTNCLGCLSIFSARLVEMSGKGSRSREHWQAKPGGADPVHRHNASAFVYVLEGSIVMQMKGGEKVTLHPGDTFYEDPEGIHLVGKNASDTKPAKFLVFLVKAKGAPLLIPVND